MYQQTLNNWNGFKVQSGCSFYEHGAVARGFCSEIEMTNVVGHIAGVSLSGILIDDFHAYHQLISSVVLRHRIHENGYCCRCIIHILHCYVE